MKVFRHFCFFCLSQTEAQTGTAGSMPPPCYQFHIWDPWVQKRLESFGSLSAFYIDRSLTAPLLFAPGSLSSYPYARTPEELLEKVEEAQRQIEDGGPLSYTQFKRVWQYIVTRSTKERTYVRYINGQKIQRTVTPKLGEKAAHNGNVVYTLENPVKSTVFTRKTERSTVSKQLVARLSSASAELTKRLLPKPWSVKAA